MHACSLSAEAVGIVVKNGTHIVVVEHGNVAIVVHPNFRIPIGIGAAGRDDVSAYTVGFEAVPAVAHWRVETANPYALWIVACLGDATTDEFGFLKAKLSATGLQHTIHPHLIRTVAIGAANAVAIAIADGKYQASVVGYAKGIAVGQAGGQGVAGLGTQQPTGFLRIVVGHNADDDFRLTAAARLG